MKHFGIALLTAAICCNAWAYGPEQTQACWKTALTQYETNDCAQAESDGADAELNRVYKTIKSRNKKDAFFLKYLDKSQLAWIKYRSAQINAKYPPYPLRRDKTHGFYYSDEYGSMQPTCELGYYTELTRERIRVLKEWLAPRLEESACYGTQGS